MTNNKRFLIGFGISFFVALFGTLFMSRFFSLASFYRFDRGQPSEAAAPRILKGEGFLKRSEFFKIPPGNVGAALSRSWGGADRKTAERFTRAETAKGIVSFSDLTVIDGKIHAVGVFGGFVIRPDGELEREFTFEPYEVEMKTLWFKTTNYLINRHDLRVVRLTRDRIGYCSADSSAGFSVFDENGDMIWNYGRQTADLSSLSESEKDAGERRKKEEFVLEGEVGDLDGDGISEYVVAILNDGVRAFAADGRELWRQPDAFPSRKLRVFDVNGDGRPELAELAPEAKVRDAGGNLIATMNIGGRDTGQVVVRDGLIYGCDLYQTRIQCTDQNGKYVLNSYAPDSEIKRPPNATPTPAIPGIPPGLLPDDGKDWASWPRFAFVKLKEDEPPFIAVTARFIGLDKALLYVFDSRGELRYEEAIPEEAETIAVLPAANGLEEILIGGKNTIWRYGIK